MPLPSSGQMKFSEINVELGRGSTTQVSLNESAVRSLFGIASGPIKKSNGRGKSNAFTFNKTISTNTQNYNLLADMIANGYTNGSAFTANITVASGVYVWSDSTSLAGFDTGAITGSGTINLTNNGFIMGRGGNGVVAANGQAGGPAMNIQRNINITNNSYIAGGGGGGAGTTLGNGTGGGGAGGGQSIYNGGVVINGGSPGNSGSNGTATFGISGGGGRILPGTGGLGAQVEGGPQTISWVRSAQGGSAGGGGGASKNPSQGGQGIGGQGGAGGNAGSNGSRLSSGAGAGGGGGWGASGGTAVAASLTIYSPGSGGKAINLNGNSVTYITTGTVYGAVS